MAVVNFSFSRGTSLQQMLAFEMAGQLWSNYLQDDITVDIQVTATSVLPDNVLGGALPNYVEVDVDQVRAALAADATSDSDATALANLNLDNGFSALLEDSSYLGDRITLTQAQAAALGIPTFASSNAQDGQIVINNLNRNRQLSWDTDLGRSGELDSNSLDLLSVALHEIGHILGFISGVDAEAQAGLSQQLAQTTLLDLYRYSDRSTEQNSRELTRGATAYFSLDGGQTSLANFSTGIVPLGNYIDGYQASHWGPGNAAADRRLSNDLNLEGSQSENLQAFVQILFDLSFEASDGDWVDSPSRLFILPPPPPPQPSQRRSSGGLFGLVGNLLGGVVDLAGALLGIPSPSSSPGTQQTLAPPSSGEILPKLGIMDPSLAAGDRSDISDLDLTAFDAIGYDLTGAFTTNTNYSQLLAQSEEALAAQLGVEVETLRDALQEGNTPESLSSSSATSNAPSPDLDDGRWQLLYNTLDSSGNSELIERRRSRYSRSYASYWQEEGVDASSVQIVSNGGEDSAEITLEEGSLNVTQIQAIPSAPLILRTKNLEGDDANDLILPAVDKVQTLNTGNGDNVAVLGSQGGRINGGLGHDTLIAQGGDSTIQDPGGDNLIWTQNAKTVTVTTGDGNDLMNVEAERATITTGDGKDTVILGNAEGAYFSGSGYATLSDFDRFDTIQLFGEVSDYSIQGDQLLYRSNTIAKFDQGIDFSLTGSQVTYIGAGQSSESLMAQSLQAVVDRYSAEPEIRYRIAGGEDAEQFQIDPRTGQLDFKAIATPGSDANQDNRFEVTVAATQTLGDRPQTVDTQALSISLGDFSLPVPSNLSTNQANLGSDLGSALATTNSAATTSINPAIPASSPEPLNLLTNGSFEANAVPNNGWTHFHPSEVAGWKSWRGERLEIWDSGMLGVESTDGSNHLELDHGRGLDGIYQDIQTQVGQTYQLTFDMRARDRNLNSDDEAVVVEWNGQKTKVDGYHAAQVGEWTTISVEVEGTGNLDRLLLRESTTRGASDGTGPLLDNVQLQAINGSSSLANAYSYGATTPVSSTLESAPLDPPSNNGSGNLFNLFGLGSLFNLT